MPRLRDTQKVLKWSLLDQQAWAARKMNDITDAHTLALHIAGWKIVTDGPDPDDGATPKWPFRSESTGCACPEWCNDLSAKPTAKVLSVINGGKPPDQPA